MPLLQDRSRDLLTSSPARYHCTKDVPFWSEINCILSCLVLSCADGYDIPKGAMVMNNTWAVHHDERVWPDNEAFLPERWLDDDGKYVFQQNGFLPFSVGRRSCVGESFAKLELHMLTTMLLQRYILKPAPGKRIDLNTIDGFVVRSPDQDIYVERRK